MAFSRHNISFGNAVKMSIPGLTGAIYVEEGRAKRWLV